MVSEITNHFFHFGISGDNQVTKPTTAVATAGVSGIADIPQSRRVSLFATIGPNPLPALDTGTYHELCSSFVLEENHVQGRDPRSRCAGVAGAVRRHDRHLVAGVQQSVGCAASCVAYPRRHSRAEGAFAPEAGHDGKKRRGALCKTGIAGVGARLGGGLGPRASPLWVTTRNHPTFE
jgi:hypothetical protein